jgi:hypothetical protein
MPKQPTISGLCAAIKKKVTLREQFVAEIEVLVPWARLLPLFATHHPKVRRKRGVC